MLEPTIAEIEAHVHAAGWDQRPMLFALVRAAQFVSDDPQTAARLGIDLQRGDMLTPIEQDELPEEPLDTVLAGIAWPDTIAGCAVSQEILVLPPSAESEQGSEHIPAEQAVEQAAAHPLRREARLVAGVLQDGTSAVLLRMRGTNGSADELLVGPDLAPNLVAALLATFA